MMPDETKREQVTHVVKTNGQQRQKGQVRIITRWVFKYADGQVEEIIKREKWK